MIYTAEWYDNNTNIRRLDVVADTEVASVQFSTATNQSESNTRFENTIQLQIETFHIYLKQICPEIKVNGKVPSYTIESMCCDAS